MSTNQNLIQKDIFEINVNLFFVIKRLIYVMLFLLVFHIVGQLIKFYYGFDHVLGFIPMFNLYEEANLPTWFSSMILLSASGLLLIIAATKRAQRDSYFLHWAGLSMVFLFLSVDEAAKLHEAVGGVFRVVAGRFLADGFASVWVIPFGVLLLIFVGAYFRFVFSLAPYFRNLFILAGLTFVSGGLGLEVVEIIYLQGVAPKAEVFMIMVSVEETMEIGGVILFIYGLLRYIEEHIGKISVAFNNTAH